MPCGTCGPAASDAHEWWLTKVQTASSLCAQALLEKEEEEGMSSDEELERIEVDPEVEADDSLLVRGDSRMSTSPCQPR